MITQPFTPEIVQETVRFTELYTRMAQQLCESLLTAEYINIPSNERELPSFEKVMERIVEMDSLKPIWYKGQYWNIDPHGDHCLFISDSGLPIEVNMYDSTRIDAAFFSSFLLHLPAAQVVVRLIDTVDFATIFHLFEYLTEQNLLIQIDGTNFKLQLME
ncbi:hypothetical protein [Paenibacillus wulumuqiensis]|uniref:hypothetical protein n=1 Tax=Paenibacillus wulumuqiensis TaxID=1567107 RepID=UPI00061993FB|nr:hypothetical protein [Paenibacillus wulumuqiensis]